MAYASGDLATPSGLTRFYEVNPHVPKHQTAVQLRAAGDRGRDPRRLAAVRAQAERLQRAIEGQRGCVRARDRGHRHRGTPGDQGEAAVWFNGARSTDTAALLAAALVAEGYGLFLLGPLWLVDRGLPMETAGTERVDGRLCDVIELSLSPGLGMAATDRVAVCIDRIDSVTRRVRFTLEGFANTRGAVPEVDTFDHERRFGMLWPMRSFERIVHPIALPAHDWHVTGIDVNRGYAAQDLAGPVFGGLAAAPAKAL